ncbi:MAG: hypothetical protein K0R65_104 [Crocinitomicaceae bacterium]|nr:hypothetical protein [Crocinitomicaceae bacterium]
MKPTQKDERSHVPQDEKWENRDKRKGDSADRGSGNSGGSNTGGNSRRRDDEQAGNH